ncbi:hypothetical protein QCA50_000813 [Cerrena zonata]|uniref:Coenzyme Q-binding protein COQ10 START domain-containing protein n=1 Tax=Cerrena zonata TaxID=2478898 RepID=A0AAW0GZM1_9APHY
MTAILARPLRSVARPHLVHRTLFTLPDLSSLSPFSDPGKKPDEPQTYHERKILPYRPSELYNVVADVESYSSFLPFCTDARVLSKSTPTTPRLGGLTSPQALARVMEAELTVGFLSFRESYVSKVTCRPNESVEAVASSSTPLFKSLSTTWRFQSASIHSPHPSSSLPPQSGSSRPHSHTRVSQQNSNITSSKDPDRGPTLVTLDLAYAFANPVHAAVSAAFFGQVSKMMVSAFEERCLDVYGPGYR